MRVRNGRDNSSAREVAGGARGEVAPGSPGLPAREMAAESGARLGAATRGRRGDGDAARSPSWTRHVGGGTCGVGVWGTRPGSVWWRLVMARGATGANRNTRSSV